MLIDRYPHDGVVARVLELAQDTDPVLPNLAHLLEDDDLYRQMQTDLGQRYPLTLVATLPGRSATPPTHGQAPLQTVS